MNTQYLDRYAELLVDIGLHIIPGDSLQISFSEESLELARKVASLAYARGALRVYLNFTDDAITLAKFNEASDEAFAAFPDYDVAVQVARIHDRTHNLALVSANPELLKSVDPERIAAWQKVSGAALKPVRELGMANARKWCVAAVPSDVWAETLFPEMDTAEAKAKLWALIFQAVRADQADPVAAWEDHNATLKARQDYLNEARFVKLRYEGPGTDFTVGLVKDHAWMGGSSPFGDGEAFMANIPTEEVFTMPHRLQAEGRLSATLPLSLHGRMVKDFWFQFEAGRVVDFGAGEGEETLQKLLDTDDGARHLGEVALVDVHSPIYQTGVLFQNTLFDENASCHFALGAAYSENMTGVDDLDADARLAAGMNDSMVHVDFMVGSDQLSITGIAADGTETAVMVRGEFVI